MRGATDFMADIAVMIRKQVVDAVPTFRWATVTGANPLRIRFDGETDPLPITPDALVNPPVGARVFVLHWMRRVTVLGRAGAYQTPDGCLSTRRLLARCTQDSSRCIGCAMVSFTCVVRCR